MFRYCSTYTSYTCGSVGCGHPQFQLSMYPSHTSGGEQTHFKIYLCTSVIAFQPITISNVAVNGAECFN